MKDLDKQIIAFLLFIIVLSNLAFFFVGYYWDKDTAEECSNKTIDAFYYGQINSRITNLGKEVLSDVIMNDEILVSSLKEKICD